jgi:hypothetical protein
MTLTIVWQDPFAAGAQTYSMGVNQVTGNGTLGTIPLTTFPDTVSIRAKAGTAIQYAVTYAPNGSCSPAPTYQVFPILEKLT